MLGRLGGANEEERNKQIQRRKKVIESRDAAGRGERSEVTFLRHGTEGQRKHLGNTHCLYLFTLKQPDPSRSLMASQRRCFDEDE